MSIYLSMLVLCGINLLIVMANSSKILDGTELARYLDLWMFVTTCFINRKLLSSLVPRIKVLQNEQNIIPRLAVIQIGRREDSNTYIRAKKRAAERVIYMARLHLCKIQVHTFSLG